MSSNTTTTTTTTAAADESTAATTAATVTTTTSSRSDINMDPDIVAIAAAAAATTTTLSSSLSSSANHLDVAIPTSSSTTTTTTTTTATNTNTNANGGSSNVNDTAISDVTHNINRTDQDDNEETNGTINDGIIATTTTRKQQQEQQQLLLVTPNGDEINAKNTLQSFDHCINTTNVDNATNKNAVTTTTTTTLSSSNNNKVDRFLHTPNGEEINAKNTLQSFDDVNTTHVDRKPTTNIETIPIRSNVGDDNDDTVHDVNSSNEDAVNVPPATMNVQAMAVVPSYGVVDAQRTDVDAPIVSNNRPWWKKTSFKLYTSIGFIIIVGVVVGISIYFSSSNTTTPLQSPSNNTSIAFPTFSPITLSQMSKIEGMTSYLNSVTLLGRNLSIDGVTPEDVALRWMINDDPIFNTTESWLTIASFVETNNSTTTSTSNGTFTSKEQFVFIQRYALLTLWFQQVDNTTGTFQRTWTSSNGWLMDPSECNWFGIECSTLLLDGIADEVGVVTEIVFNNNEITGTISADLGLLRWIRHVTFVSLLVDNSGEVQYTGGLSGTIPSTALGQWTALTYINVAGQRDLTGTLPSTIGEWTALTHFDFSHNSLSGIIPSKIEQWMALEHFDVRNNIKLIGTLPSTIGQWMALTYFDVSFNALSGTLPSTIGQWKALTYFDVTFNALNGKLPSSIGQWTSLTYFDVSYSFFLNGTIPSEIEQWTTLEHFATTGSKFNGTLLSTIGQWTTLTYFNIADSYYLNGTLPSTIGQWTALTYFDVRFNSLGGSLPSSIGNWTALEHFDVSYNYFLNGPLPSTIGQWTALTYFDVNFNELSGTLPSTIGQWKAMTFFTVAGNSFTGTIPSSVGNWDYVKDRTAYFFDNQLNGTMPIEICDLDPDVLVVDCTVNCSCCTEDCVLPPDE